MYTKTNYIFVEEVLEISDKLVNGGGGVHVSTSQSRTATEVLLL